MRWAALALCYGGWLALCLAMPKHYKQVWQKERSVVRSIFRSLGWLSLCLALVVSVRAGGWSFGSVEWVGLLALTGITLVMVLPYAPRWAAAGGIVMLFVACAILVA